MIAVGRRAISLMCSEMEDYFRSLGIELNFVEECFSSNEALHSVAQGNNLCLLPESQARSSAGGGREATVGSIIHPQVWRLCPTGP